MTRMVYFGTKGITSTSATTIANYAVESKKTLLAFLDNLCFYSETRDLVGTNSSEKLVQMGYNKDDLFKVPSVVQGIAELDMLNAWLREAVKAKEELLNTTKSTQIDDWADKNGITLPTRPSRETIARYCERNGIEYPKTPVLSVVTVEDIIAEMNIKEYNEYISCNSASAVYGKLTNEDGSFNSAKNSLAKVITHPYDITDTMIKHYTPTVDFEDVNKVFTKLKTVYRNYEGQHNGILKKIKETVLSRNIKLREEYSLALNEYNKSIDSIKDSMEKEYLDSIDNYNTTISTLQTQFNDWLEKKVKDISELKIVIPDALNDTYTRLDNSFKSGI